MDSRTYQKNAIDAVIHEYDTGTRRMIISAATGSGKTIIVSKLYESIKTRLPGKMLFLAHREELVDQAIDKLRIVNPDIKVDKEMAGHRADPVFADVIVASVATLGRKNTKRIEDYNWNTFDKIVIDEAHHTPAQSYKNILCAADVFHPNSPKLLLGITATPQRSDGKALADIYQKIVYVYSLRQAIEDGWLVDVRGLQLTTATNLNEVKQSAGDFQREDLSRAVNTPERNKRIVEVWQERGENRQTLAFTVDIDHAQKLALAFNEAGIKAEAVWGDDKDRAQKLQDFRDGKIKMLCNCAVLTEGYDDWHIACVLLARPTMSAVLFSQMIGRGTRLQEGTGNLKAIKFTDPGWSNPVTKKDCLIIDVVDNCSKHSLVTLPSLMGLPGAFNLQGTSLVSAIHAIEAAQSKHSNIDFTKLKDITKLNEFIQSVNLFDVRFPEEVETNSDLMWFKATTGGYRLTVPRSKLDNAKPGQVSIFQNMLGQWELVGCIENNPFHGIRSTMEEAFKVADEQIRNRTDFMRMNLMRRHAEWHGKAATPGQFALLHKFFPWKTFPNDLTRGQASKLIDERLSKVKK